MFTYFYLQYFGPVYYVWSPVMGFVWAKKKRCLSSSSPLSVLSRRCPCLVRNDSPTTMNAYTRSRGNRYASFRRRAQAKLHPVGYCVVWPVLKRAPGFSMNHSRGGGRGWCIHVYIIHLLRRVVSLRVSIHFNIMVICCFSIFTRNAFERKQTLSTQYLTCCFCKQT